MTAAAAEMLVREIMPRIASAVPRILKRGGSEDDGELVQDGTVQAVDAIESLETRGQPLYAASIAFYTLQRLKSGRRANYAGRADAMSVAAQLDGRSALSSMDEPIPSDTEGDELTLHDVLSNDTEDPSQVAARELDWNELLGTLTDRELAIVEATANGDQLDRLAVKLGISPPRVTQIKQAIGRQVKARWGAGVLADVARPPRWSSSLMATWQRELCRHARARAAAW